MTPSTRDGTEQDLRALVGIAVLFLLLRLLFMGSDYICEDQVGVLTGGLEWIEWWSVPEYALQKTLHTTNPYLPMLVARVLNNIFGPSILVQRLPAVLVSFASLLLLYRLLTRLLRTKGARFLPLVLFTLSVPSIIYARQIHQSIWYFLTTVLQLYVFASVAARLRADTTLPSIQRGIQLIARVSLIALLMNWMSIIVFAMLMVCYSILVMTRCRAEGSARRSLIPIAVEIGLESLPVLVLAYLRVRLGGGVRSYFRPHYYIDELSDIPRLTFDLISYHFNFAYDTSLYRPLGENPLAIPFVGLIVLGAVFFMGRGREHALLALVAAVTLGTAYVSEVMPFGGVRHSLTVAPFLFILVGFGIEGLHAGMSRLGLPMAVARWLTISCALLSTGVFLMSGSHLYVARASRIDLDDLVALVSERNVGTMVGFQDAYTTLRMMDHSRGGPLSDLGVEFKIMGDDAYDSRGPRVSSADADFLLVAYMRPLDIDFDERTATTLREDPGLAHHYDPTVQSIYHPLNGYFVYHVHQ